MPSIPLCEKQRDEEKLHDGSLAVSGTEKKISQGIQQSFIKPPARNRRGFIWR